MGNQSYTTRMINRRRSGVARWASMHGRASSGRARRRTHYDVPDDDRRAPEHVAPARAEPVEAHGQHGSRTHGQWPIRTIRR